MLSHFIVSCIVLWRLCTWLVQLKVIFYPPVVYFKIWPLLHRAIFSWMSNVENRASFSTDRVKTETNRNSRFIRILPQFRRFVYFYSSFPRLLVVFLFLPIGCCDFYATRSKCSTMDKQKNNHDQIRSTREHGPTGTIE